MLVETTLVLLTLILGCLGPTTSFNRTNKLRGFSNAFHSLSVSPRLVLWLRHSLFYLRQHKHPMRLH
ncbi:hypothetical protein B296_00000002 [Ensete ventricosum]|uniref:Secreted protein n=1 Tax=Ensete ventricosum TaxID=4639 RepID=A0A427ASI4_ENSVE|nr:hypothetical protein B296_00000002 [Ensete ventricosum]